MKTSIMLMGVLTTVGAVFADTPTGWWTEGMPFRVVCPCVRVWIMR